jgi:hypothetical protein
MENTGSMCYSTENGIDRLRGAVADDRTERWTRWNEELIQEFSWFMKWVGKGVAVFCVTVFILVLVT